MQARPPMQTSRSRSTMPSLRFSSAFTGQIFTHGALLQWLQRRTAKWRRISGKRPFSTYLTQVRKSPTGTSFSCLHATVQAWQPMQRRWSMRKPYCIGSSVPAERGDDSDGPDRSIGSLDRQLDLDLGGPAGLDAHDPVGHRAEARDLGEAEGVVARRVDDQLERAGVVL